MQQATVKEEFICNERIVQVKPPRKQTTAPNETMRSRIPGYQSSSSEENDAVIKIERSPGDNSSYERSSNLRPNT
jgi:hypothetical protein